MPPKNTREVPVGPAASALPPGEPAAKTGPAVIAHYLKTLPSSPGVYRMIDAGGTVIYVGKARNLKARVTSYARAGNHTNRIARMISATAAMEFVTVRTEAEALLLEANLIKRFRPRFNVLMRDDKSFPYILIARDHAAPQILKHRGARNRKGDYFGPFASAGAVNRTINMLERAFLLRSCSDPVFESRTRPCLLYQIKRCSAPCTGEIALEDYAGLVEEATRFLKGESQNARQMYQRLMQEAAANLDYEQAAKYRNRLWALAHVTADQNINPEGIEEADVFAAYQEGGQTCVQVFFFRSGQNWGNRAYFPRADKSLAVEEVLEAFIAQFYDDKPVPRCIFLSHALPMQALLEEALSTKAERRVEIRVPQRGTKTTIVEHATQNAREALGRRLAETSSQRILLDALKERFGLMKAPRRIEVFDNSHIQGASAVGAMIVAGPEGFVKNQYRKFNIKSEGLAPGDDYAMMREVLHRRFRRLVTPPADGAKVRADDDSFPQWPDVVIIDGGRGQLNAAKEIFDSLGLTRVALLAVAKGPDRDAGRETLFMPGREAIKLEPRARVRYFIQRLRDEAHRFVIGSHRKLRKKDIREAGLQEIPGIGPSRKRALLHHFGTLKEIERASIADLGKVPGVSAESARRIFDYFHPQPG